MQARLLAIGLLLFLCGCSPTSTPKTFTLDENQAIAAANGFLQAIMAQDWTQAYTFISPGAKFTKQMKFEQFSADLEAIRGKFGPIQKATFDAYQLVPGKRVIQLYYQVKHQKADVLTYHLLVEVDPLGHYTLFLVDVGDGQPYPSSNGPQSEKLKKAEPIVLVPGSARQPKP